MKSIAAIGLAVWCCGLANASTQGRFVDADRARIYYEVEGTGDHIVSSFSESAHR